jgi:lipopolysaccharide/colanic/teichoic acid biosynthesis glycosyltransferase
LPTPHPLNLVAPETDAAPASLSRLRREWEAQGFAPLSRPGGWYPACKLAFDFVLALVLSVLALPLIVLAALLVRVTSRGPAFYTQRRVGKDGRVFTIFKLRTMIDKCESLTGPRWCLPGDPRVTAVGWVLRKLHLDELPQLLNVLKGEMSLIGPRPERPEFLPELEQALPGYRQRLLVRPGVSGLAQVQLPPDSDLSTVRRKLAHDLWYVRSLGPWLDLRLLVCTACYAVGIPFGIAGRLLRLPDRDTVETAMRPHLGEPTTPRARISA